MWGEETTTRIVGTTQEKKSEKKIGKNRTRPKKVKIVWEDLCTPMFICTIIYNNQDVEATEVSIDR